MKIALTGGTGFVGRATLDRALDAGHDVVALTRSEQAPRKGVTWIRGDLADRGALRLLVRDCEAVLHIAGVVNAPDAEGFETGNVAGTLNLVEASHRAGVPRFVFVSSLAAREPSLSAYGASKQRAETFVRASGLDWTIVRPPAIYGPRDSEMLDLFKAAKWGFVPIPAEGAASILHVDDLARLLLALLPGGEGITGAVFEPDDGRAGGWPHDDMARAIGWAMGRRPRVIGLSRTALERAAKADRMLRGKRAKMTADRAAYFSHPDWVSGASARVPVDLWAPRIETREGLKATAAWYRENDWI